MNEERINEFAREIVGINGKDIAEMGEAAIYFFMRAKRVLRNAVQEAESAAAAETSK